MELGKGKQVLFLLVPCVFIFSPAFAIRADLYLNKDKFGEFLRMDISEKGCTNVPLNWDNQAISLDTHGSCIKFYDLPYCRGKYVALQPYHGTFQDNLETIGFKHLVSSASPCGPKVPSGRYYILNGADGSVLTIDKRNYTVGAKTLPFKPYVTKNQQFQIDKISLADYEIIPRVHEDLNPLTFDMTISTRQHPVRRTWRIESVYRGKYIIKNEWNNRCLYKSESGKVEEHECVAWSPNQEWMFKAIKVQPFFPSKEELNKTPIKPDEQLPFHPQQDIFPHPQFNFPHHNIRPGQPLRHPSKDKKKRPQADISQPVRNRPFDRPNPIVINPHEPYPAVQPVPIFPVSAHRLPQIGHHDPNRPPVPHVHHPGRLPFPREPIVTDPKKPLFPPTLFAQFGPTPKPTGASKKKPGADEEDEDQDEKDEDDKEEEEEKDDEEKEEDEKDDEDKEEEEEKDDKDEQTDKEDKDEADDDDKDDTEGREEDDKEDDAEDEVSQEKEEPEDDVVDARQSQRRTGMSSAESSEESMEANDDDEDESDD